MNYINPRPHFEKKTTPHKIKRGIRNFDKKMIKEMLDLIDKGKAIREEFSPKNNAVYY